MSQGLMQIAPNLWVAQSRSLHLNSGIFLSAGQACLVDPGLLPDEIEALARFVGQQGAAVRRIVLTHSDWDHILGPERLPGIPIVAQAAYLRALAEDDGSVGRMIARWEAHHHIARERPFSIPPPDETFGKAMTLRVGELSLELTHAPGHAADQLAIYQAESATLWAGDMLSDLEIPFVIHSLSAYERTLARIAALEIRALVPGHGNLTADPGEIRARLSADMAYLAELRARVERAVQEGSTVTETAALCADMVYRNRAENAEPHRLNVETAYVELGGAVDPDTVGYRGAWKKMAGADNR